MKITILVASSLWWSRLYTGGVSYLYEKESHCCRFHWHCHIFAFHATPYMIRHMSDAATRHYRVIDDYWYYFRVFSFPSQAAAFAMLFISESRLAAFVTMRIIVARHIFILFSRYADFHAIFYHFEPRMSHAAYAAAIIDIYASRHMRHAAFASHEATRRLLALPLIFSDIDITFIIISIFAFLLFLACFFIYFSHDYLRLPSPSSFLFFIIRLSYLIDLMIIALLLHAARYFAIFFLSSSRLRHYFIITMSVLYTLLILFIEKRRLLRYAFDSDCH